MGGTPIALTVAQLEQCNRETIACMMQNLKERTAHDDHKYKLGVESHATRYTDNNTTRSGNIEALMAEQQRDLDRYVGEKRPPEIDFRVGVVDAPLDTADIESLLDDQKKQRMQIDTPLIAVSNDYVLERPALATASSVQSIESRLASMEQHLASMKQDITSIDHRIQLLEQICRNNVVIDIDDDDDDDDDDNDDDDNDNDNVDDDDEGSGHDNDDDNGRR
jgi:hypothetical protein